MPSHHVCYLHEATGDAFVGDVAGVRIPPHEYTLAPTPPPDIDVEAWLDSLDAIEAWDPAALCLTHFGRFEDVARRSSTACAPALDRCAREPDADAEACSRGSTGEIEAAVDADTVAAYLQAAPPDHDLVRAWSATGRSAEADRHEHGDDRAPAHGRARARASAATGA